MVYVPRVGRNRWIGAQINILQGVGEIVLDKLIPMFNMSYLTEGYLNSIEVD